MDDEPALSEEARLARDRDKAAGGPVAGAAAGRTTGKAAGVVTGAGAAEAQSEPVAAAQAAGAKATEAGAGAEEAIADKPEALSRRGRDALAASRQGDRSATEAGAEAGEQAGSAQPFARTEKGALGASPALGGAADAGAGVKAAGELEALTRRGRDVLQSHRATDDTWLKASPSLPYPSQGVSLAHSGAAAPPPCSGDMRAGPPPTEPFTKPLTVAAPALASLSLAGAEADPSPDGARGITRQADAPAGQRSSSNPDTNPNPTGRAPARAAAPEGAAAEDGGRVMRMYQTTVVDPAAVCNDGSPGAFYHRSGVGDGADKCALCRTLILPSMLPMPG